MIDIILQVDAIRPPLTGIGRYALELAQGLRAHPDIHQLRTFGIMNWVDSANIGAPLTSAKGTEGKLRARLASSQLAVRAYHQLVPRVAGWRLRHERHSLYHSPSYFLPPLAGPGIATIHDLSHELVPHTHPAARVSYVQRALPISLARAQHLITDSHAVRGEIIKHYNWPAERISTVPLGATPDFQPRTPEQTRAVLQRHGLQHGRYILFVGTIEPRKNVDRLLHAYGSLPAHQRAAMPLVLVGGAGWKSEHTHQLMARAQSQGWARYLAYAPQAELPMLYAGARAFVFPSLYEGFGLPVLEAMASKTAVITSSVSAMPEVIGDCGLTVDPHDETALRDSLERLIEDDALCADLARRGWQRSRQFSWQRCVSETVEVYRRVLAK